MRQIARGSSVAIVIRRRVIVYGCGYYTSLCTEPCEVQVEDSLQPKCGFPQWICFNILRQVFPFTTGAEIVTYLPLQMVLYFNVFYSPLWVIVCIFTLENKVRQLCEPKKGCLYVRDDVKTLSEYISNLLIAPT